MYIIFTKLFYDVGVSKVVIYDNNSANPAAIANPAATAASLRTY